MVRTRIGGIPRWRAAAAGLVLSLGVAAQGGVAAAARGPGREERIPREAAVREAVQRARARDPVRFEPNLGQTDPEVRFLARAPGMTVFLTDREAVFRLAGPRAPRRDPRPDEGTAGPSFAAAEESVLRMTPVDGAARPSFEASTPLAGRSNHFHGKDPSRWRTGVPHFGAVTARGVWPGVDLRFRGDPARLEYDLLLAPGADPGRTRFRYTGQSSLRVEASGDLVLSFPEGELRQSAPVIWQERPGGVRRAVAGGFRVLGDGLVGFEVGRYDPSLPLVVDPKVGWSTFLGGSNHDWALDIAVDGSGNVIVAGLVDSTDFPTTSPYQSATKGGTGSWTATSDGFVTKYASSLASVVFSTYLGGTREDRCYGVAADSAGAVLVCGSTSSTDFPTAAAYQANHGGGTIDMFVTKLNASGSSLDFSTYIGKSGDEAALDVIPEAGGNIVVSGSTTSGNFPLAGAVQTSHGGGTWDAVALRLSSAGDSLLWSTLFGGSGIDYGEAVNVDSNGAVFLSGETVSANFPVKDPLQASFGGGVFDVYVAKFAPGGASLAYSTYIGGSGADYVYTGNRVELTSTGEVFVGGTTDSNNFPLAGAYQSFHAGSLDAFLLRLNNTGSGLVFSTYFGGSGDDYTQRVGLGPGGTVFTCGFTTSTNFPLRNAFQNSFLGGGNPADDSWIARFSGNGATLHYSSYLSSTGFDEIMGMAVDGNGNPVVVGITAGGDFPVVDPVQPNHGGGFYDTFVARIDPALPAVPTDLSATTVAAAIELAWTDLATDETGTEVERRTPAGSWLKLATTAVDADSYTDKSIAPSTTYTYRVRAVNADGASGYSGEASATSPAIVPVPVSPNLLAAVAVSTGRIDLTWNDRSDNEGSFEVQRKAENGAFATVASLPQDAESWSSTGLAPDTAYSFRVRAVGASGPSLYSGESVATTLPTLTVTPDKGSVTDSPKTGKDKVKVSGTYAFLPDSPDAALDPQADGIAFFLVGDASPLVVAVPAGDEGWKEKKGKYTWKSPRGSVSKFAITIDPANGTFKISGSKVTLQAPPANPIRVTIRCGNDAGSLRSDWTSVKEGVFRLP